MACLSALRSHSSAKTTARSAGPLVPSVHGHRPSAAKQSSPLLPAQPSSIPVVPFLLTARPVLEIGSAGNPLERQAEAMAAHAVDGRSGPDSAKECAPGREWV